VATENHRRRVLVEAAHAKLNLTLAITGRRADGFHELVSLVASISLADHLALHLGQPLGMTCDDSSLPTDETNLVLKAAAAYQRRRPDAVVGRFHLTKKIPHGAGLGGGSSDAAAALRLLDRAAGAPLGVAALEAIAAEVGSDCPYFIRSQSAMMRGRGERLEILSEAPRRALVGRRVLIVKPPFGVPTPEAYGLLAKAGVYRAPAKAEAELAAWVAQPAADPSLIGNDLEALVFGKHLALPVACDEIALKAGIRFRLTGSGSACFAFVSEGFEPTGVRSACVAAWGPGAWLADAVISG
jgi:4-diphosphocytidyl-2-C-methyl-D-erythritol kinase